MCRVRFLMITRKCTLVLKNVLNKRCRLDKDLKLLFYNFFSKMHSFGSVDLKLKIGFLIITRKCSHEQKKVLNKRCRLHQNLQLFPYDFFSKTHRFGSMYVFRSVCVYCLYQILVIFVLSFFYL